MRANKPALTLNVCWFVVSHRQSPIQFAIEAIEICGGEHLWKHTHDLKCSGRAALHVSQGCKNDGCFEFGLSRVTRSQDFPDFYPIDEA